ncbi:MAG: sporulation peptidase YabG [Anaeroplasmataceae bacterium]
MQIGDYVTRKSHNNDIVFKIIGIDGNIASLSGARVRLIADSDIKDLILYNNKIDIDSLKINNIDGVINGLVLHIDGDKDYLEECMKFYENNKIPAIGYFIDEEKMPFVIEDLLNKHLPDILVLTGHDGIRNGRYINSKYYYESIIKARRLENNKDNLIIISGGCFSDYLSLIKGGANFASSPKGVVIDVLDPAKIASMVSVGLVESYLDIDGIIDMTMNKKKGIGGIDTKGTARKIH